MSSIVVPVKGIGAFSCWPRMRFTEVEVSTGTAAKCARGCSTGTLKRAALEDEILNVLGRLGVLLDGIVT